MCVCVEFSVYCFFQTYWLTFHLHVFILLGTFIFLGSLLAGNCVLSGYHVVLELVSEILMK